MCHTLQYLRYDALHFAFIRLLENELQKVQKTAEQKEKDLQSQIGELKADNDRQQKLIGQVGLDRITMVTETSCIR